MNNEELTSTGTPAESSPKEPFVGTRPFETGERLFGRDQEIQSLTNRLLARRVVLLHAISGAGKTSLIQASLVPQMEEMGNVVLPIIRVNKTPPPELPSINPYVYSMFTSLGDQISEACEEMTDPLAIDLPARVARLREVAAEEAAAGEEPGWGTLLIFDQFEELFSLDITNQAEKEAFLIQLMPVLLDISYSIVFSMREDYLADLESFLTYFPERLSSRFRLELLKEPAAVEAIIKPLELFGITFDQEAANDLVHDLSQISVWQEGAVQRLPGIYIEPMHLQVVARTLWQAPRPNRSRITAGDVKIWGDVDQALLGYYNEMVGKVASSTVKREQDLRDWIEISLITPQDLRGNVRAGQETDFDLDEETVRQLTRTHIVRREERRQSVWYELAHDRLVKPVRRANAAWRKDLILLQSNARLWHIRQRPAELLLSGADLFEAEAWATNNSSRITSLEKEYLQASRRAYQAARSEHASRAELGFNLEEIGWGVIFAEDADPAVREALKELLDHRRRQASQLRDDYYREFHGIEFGGYRSGDTAYKFLERAGAGYGPANPEKVPYYLLIVGSPEQIPFEFQYELDMQYAVGRLYFDTLEAYQSYARSVVLSESGNFLLPNKVTFFAPKNPDDHFTELVVPKVVDGLIDSLEVEKAIWNLDEVREEAATRANLVNYLGGENTPALLFTAAHGVDLPPDHRDQALHQGSLVCYDWPGPKKWQGAIPPDFYFGARDVSDNARLLGLIAFLWGSNSAGTPVCSDYPFSREATLAKQPFLTALPQRLLGHPQGGALAVIGLVEVGYAYSAETEGGTGDLGAFTNTLQWLMKGCTVGKAMEEINRRYATFSTLLANELRQVQFYGRQQDEQILNRMMTQTIDARNYIVLGDPAVRLPVKVRVEEGSQPQTPDWVRPVIEAIRPMTTSKRTRPVVKETTPQTELEESDLLFFNGVDGETGEYNLRPRSPDELVKMITGASPPDNLNELRFRFSQSTSAHLGVRVGINPERLDEAGWGIIFAADADPAIQEALGPLLELRRAQAGEYFRVFARDDGYRPDESKTKFLARHGAGPGPADPSRVPYYLLLVGSPDAIPFRFQSQLDVQYAVGRIDFDTLDDYDRYARSVVAAERGENLPAPRAAFFGVANQDDRNTIQGVRDLIEPLAASLDSSNQVVLKRTPDWDQPEWQITQDLGEAATRARLLSLLGGVDTPAFLLAAAHGMTFPSGSPRQLREQGALLCQDWPGPQQWQQAIPPDFYVTGDDLDPNGSLLGQIAFFFACFSGGTPRHDGFYRQEMMDSARELAPKPFLARLPKAMLSHPGGGALAVVAHVDRTWSYSYRWPGAGQQTTVFESSLRGLMEGRPLGYALEFFNERYAELATVLSDVQEEIDFGKQADPQELITLWTANNDARGYTIIGDPAVRLIVSQATLPPEQDSLSISDPDEAKTNELAPREVELLIRIEPLGPYDSFLIEVIRGTEEGRESLGQRKVKIKAKLFDYEEFDPKGAGNHLWDQILGENEAAINWALDLAAKEDSQVHLTLHMPPTAVSLKSIPLETLYSPVTKAFVALSENVFFSRYLTSPGWTRLEKRFYPSERNLRALAVVAGSREELPVNLDRASLAENAFPNVDTFVISSWLEGPVASSKNLTAYLFEEAIDILYLDCHIALVQEQVILWLEDDDGNLVLFQGSDLVGLIASSRRPPRLIMLANGKADALATLAPQLLEAGIGAVITLSDEIGEETLRTFVLNFGEALLTEEKVDRSMARGRLATAGRPDWWMPVLYHRLRDGRLWEATP